MNAQDWVLVCDTQVAGDVTAQQLDVLRERRLQLQAVVDCSDPKYAELQVCSAVPAFTAFCHRPTGKCYSGVCDADEHFAQLAERETPTA